MTHQTRRQFVSRLATGAAAIVAGVWQDSFGRLLPRTLAEVTPVQTPWIAPGFGEIEGSISDMGSGQPLAGAVIHSAGMTTSCDTDGHYALALPVGDYDLRVQAEGFIPMTVVGLRVLSDAPTHLDVEMIPEHPTPSQAQAIDEKILARSGSGIAQSPHNPSLTAVASVPSTLRVVRNYPPYGVPLPPNYVPDVVTMNLDEYLRGVVPSEMPSYWHPEALKAQAVAARSYATATSYHAPYADICTTTHCQAWNNVQYDRTNQAIAATHGIVATYHGNIISAFYFGHCTGHTVNTEDKYPGWYVPYCRGVPCAPCAAQNYSKPWGHEVGMCQEGAQGYAIAPHNWNYTQILHHYYTGISLTLPIRLTAPAPGQLVRGVVLATAEVSVAPDRVEFYLDDTLVALTNTAPWQAKLTTAGLSDGTHTIKAKAISSLNPSETSVNILVDNTPPSGTASAAAGWHNTTRIPFSLSANGSDAVSVQFSNNWIWEGEDLYHNIGSKVDDTAALNGRAWRAESGSWGDWYGPYYLLLPAAPSFQAYYRLKTSARQPGVDLALLDVVDGYGARSLAQRTLYSDDFPSDNVYSEIMLAYAYGAGTPAGQGGLEFRTRLHGSRDLTLDRVTVFGSPRPLANTLYWDVARRDGEQTVIVRFLDAAGNTFDRTVTVWLDVTAPTMTQQGANSALAQDTVSGLDPANAAWSDSADGGASWSSWQPLTGLSALPGTIEPVQLSAPVGAGADVRFRIADMAGNFNLTRGITTLLPLLVNQTGG
ncbi:MAG: SpoIID/LytB domain-containing protein [Anaerolineae bacterium]